MTYAAKFSPQTSAGLRALSALAGALALAADPMGSPQARSAAGQALLTRLKEAGVAPDALPEILEKLRTPLAALKGTEPDDVWREGTEAFAASLAGAQCAFRPVRVANRIEECPGVVSFLLAPVEGALPEFLPGQSIVLRSTLEKLGLTEPRRYALSEASGSGMYRITVKAGETPESISSRLLKRLEVGDIIEVSTPAGDFTPDLTAEHPLVLISAGIGIVPMVPILESLAVRNPMRRVHLIHSAPNGASFPLRASVDRAVAAMPNAARAYFFTKPAPTDRLGTDYHAEGRLSVEKLRSFAQDPDADFYVCGPKDFMAMVTEALRSMGVIAPRIRCESFGI